MKQLILSFILLSIVTTFISCSTNPVTGNRDFMLLSESQEKEMGRNADPEVIAYFGLYDDPELQRFITEKGKAMAAISHRPDLGYEFKIVDSPVVNAFAVPGGYVYFTRGIMAHFNNEAEFAGVLGHEIGHITARHSAKQYSRGLAAQLGLSLGSALSSDFEQLAGVAQAGTSVLFLKFGRDAERQSDELGVSYSTEVGYDATEMAGFFSTLERLSASSGQSVPNFLSTHPDPGERANTVAQLAKKEKGKSQGSLSVNRDRYLEMIDGMVYGEDPRQGFVENNYFYHPELKFSFPIPSGWSLQNSPSQVQIVSSSGDALILFALSSEKNAESAIQNTISKNNLLEEDRKSLTINGNSAVMARVSQQSEQQAIDGYVYAIEFQGKVYQFISVTTDEKFSSYSRLLSQTPENFKRLTDSNKLNRQPQRLSIITVSGNGTLQSHLQRNGVSSGQMEEVAILNGMTLSENISKGAKIKIIK